MNRIIFGESLEVLRGISSSSIRLIYIDPPFNTGKRRTRKTTVARRVEEGGRVGFSGHRYEVRVVGEKSFDDHFSDYLGFLRPRLEEAHRVLTEDGSIFVHLDYREVHYVKVLMDQVFGRDQFMNEIIWAYDFGGKPKSRWPAKHDNLLWYVKDRKNYVFNAEEVPRIPYMAPDLVGEEKAKRGKLPTDVWWHTIVPTNGKEKTGYPTQKPLGVLERIVRVHSNPGDFVLDFFARSGTTGEAAVRLGRKFLLVDNNPEAIRVMYKRLGKYGVELEGCEGLDLEG